MITTNIDNVTARIRLTARAAVLELSGDVDSFDAVNVDAVANAHGFRVVDVLNTDSMLLDVTDDSVRALRAEAIAVGDEVMARVCAEALSQDATVRVLARREVALAKIESMGA
jgi:hypothetical protein